MTNWKKLINIEMKNHNDRWKNVISCTITEKELLKNFDSGFGSSEGLPFTVWTKKRVYFPVCYDGVEWVGSVSREPDGISTKHLGGE